MTENRRHKGLIRVYPDTFDDMKRVSLAEGIQMATLLQTAWDFYTRNKALKPCRNCGVPMEGSRLTGPLHLASCPLYRDSPSRNVMGISKH